MAQTAGGTYYAASSELVSSWPATSLDLANQLESRFAAKAPLALSINAQTGTSYTLAIADSGRVVTMTNAAASTVTIPTNASVAVPIGSSVEVVNLSTGVNTTVSAAGGVTFNGGPVVLSPGSSVTLVKIGTDAWMAQGQGSPGLVHIASTTFSSASSVSVNNCFTSTYDNYRIIVSGAKTASGSYGFRFRLRASAADNVNSNYQYGRLYVGLVDNIAFASVNNTTATYWEVANVSDTYGSSFVIDVSSPALTERTGFVASAAANTMSFLNGILTVTTAYDGFTIYPGTSTMSGTVRVYGYKN